MVQARFRVLALATLLLSGAMSAAAQEVVLTDGSRLAGEVERYEDGFAYIRLFIDRGKTVLTTMPESDVDKAATEQAQATKAAVVATQEPQTTAPFKLPHNDLSQRGPGMAAVAAEEKERRAKAMDSGAATGRVFKNGQGATSIPSDRQIEELADLREQPRALPDMDADARIAGLRFYEARLETLHSAFGRLNSEWEEMWRHCTPVTYKDGQQASSNASNDSRPFTSYREAVMNTFRRKSTSTRMDDKWSIACVRKDSDYVARGKHVVEAYDSVFDAYADFAQNTGLSAQAVARALPASNSR